MANSFSIVSRHLRLLRERPIRRFTNGSISSFRATCSRKGSYSLRDVGNGRSAASVCWRNFRESFEWCRTNATAANHAAVRNIPEFEKNPEFDALEEDYAVRARVDQNQVEKLLDQLKRSGTRISFDQSQLLIRCCGSPMVTVRPQERLKTLDAIWNLLPLLGVQVSTDHYNALLSVWLENQHRFSIVDILSEMESDPAKAPDTTTFQLLLSRYCHDGDVEGASTILEHMKSKGFSINSDVFNALVYCYAKRGDMAGVDNILKAMEAANMRPNPITYRNIALPYAEKGDVTKVKEIDERAMSGSNFGLNERDWFELIYALSANGHSSKLPELLASLPRKPASLFKAHEIALRLIMLDKHEDALKVALTSVKEMEEADDDSVSYVVYTMLAMKTPINALHGFFQYLMEQNLHSQPYERALYSALRHHDAANALDIVRYMADHRGVPPRPPFFYPLLIDSVKMSPISNTVSLILRLHRSFNLQLNFREAAHFIFRFMPEDKAKQFVSMVRQESSRARSNAALQYSERLVHYYNRHSGIFPEEMDHEDVRKQSRVDLDTLPLEEPSSIDVLEQELETSNSLGDNVKPILRRLVLASCYCHDEKKAMKYFDGLLETGNIPSAFVQELSTIFQSLGQLSKGMKKFILHVSKHVDPMVSRQLSATIRLSEWKGGEGFGKLVDLDSLPLEEPSSMGVLEKELETAKSVGGNVKPILRRLVFASCYCNDGKKATKYFGELLQTGSIPSAFVQELSPILRSRTQPSEGMKRFVLYVSKRIDQKLARQLSAATTSSEWKGGEGVGKPVDLDSLALEEPSSIGVLEKELETANTLGGNVKPILRRLVFASCYCNDKNKAMKYFDELLHSGSTLSAFVQELSAVLRLLQRPSRGMKEFVVHVSNHIGPTLSRELKAAVGL